jgi:type III pantothenate kinase
MILAIDIGNTNITAGLFNGKRLAGKAKTPTHATYLYGRFFRSLLRSAKAKIPDVDGVVISSVVPLELGRLVMELNTMGFPRPAIVGRDVKAPVRNMYRNKDEVGQDRLVNAAAAKALYGVPAVIVDFGTAITFDIVSARGEYLGGLILPGIEMSLSSLYRKTALLPRVELKPASSIIGRDTVSSVRGGILFGFGTMCDGLVAQYRKMLGKRLKVIATGGNAGLIKRYAKSIQVVDEDLTLKGLFLIGRF